MPCAPGGNSDTIARLLQARVAELLGPPLVIENRSGAGGTNGAGLVVQAPADGYPFLIDSSARLTVPHAVKRLGFDHSAAFTPVGQVVDQPCVLAVGREIPVRDLAGFVALAKQRAGAGAGRMAHPGREHRVPVTAAAVAPIVAGSSVPWRRRDR